MTRRERGASRADPPVVWPVTHEVLGLTEAEALALAEIRGWELRNMTTARFVFSDYRSYRVNVWLGQSGRVERAEFY